MILLNGIPAQSLNFEFEREIKPGDVCVVRADGGLVGQPALDIRAEVMRRPGPPPAIVDAPQG